MAYQALYRKYRPSNFDEVVGQTHIIQTLKNAIVQNRIAHAYLFCGPRGTGKTSIAKIFAKTLNCTNSQDAPCGICENCKMAANGSHPDIIEIDALAIMTLFLRVAAYFPNSKLDVNCPILLNLVVSMFLSILFAPTSS